MSPSKQAAIRYLRASCAIALEALSDIACGDESDLEDQIKRAAFCAQKAWSAIENAKALEKGGA